MSLSINASFMTAFQRMFMHEFTVGQDGTDLSKYVSRGRIDGNKLVFNIRGNVSMKKLADGQQFAPKSLSDVSVRTVELIPQRYTVAVPFSLYDDARAIAAEMQSILKEEAEAALRTKNQIIIDILEGCASKQTVAVNYGGSASNFNLLKHNQAVDLLNKKNVPRSDRVWVMHTSTSRSILNDSQFTDSQLITAVDKGAMSGGVITRLGDVPVVSFGDWDNVAEAGLPLTGTQRKIYLMQKSAVGFGSVLGEKTKVSKRDDLQGHDVYDVQTTLDFAGTELKGEGVVEVICDESVS